MGTLIATVFALFLMAMVGGLLVWAFSAACRFLAALVADPTDTTTP
ncbi:TPA: hypothetical protein QDZ99_001330 [Stenotrophomonas maltophilia]|nr:hypothetical protein [Stenotrophomonas maltophilia]HDS1156986.1 hypothetical protein [Stenotrophomonas maltophilia]HDS1165380.1 hypothetical protein [Stenotrophomonas maltophilia]HDS1169635.1 hypothetical protein [Stenotrophomonas maltophilia]HDS1175388.1 hypothetical protein [Stenotrophomonas maltophilia]